jgi:hypothetical protein
MSDGVRVRILCEDRLSERFLRGLCKRFDLQVLDVAVAPSGHGAASNWVAKQYPKGVKLRRAQSHQRNLGLVVHVDGDNLGGAGRKALLGRQLQEQNLPPRGVEERIALLVPTWCIETWLLHLSGIAQPPETEKLKRDTDSDYQSALRALDDNVSGTIKAAVQSWPSEATASLTDGDCELKRILPG